MASQCIWQERHPRSHSTRVSMHNNGPCSIPQGPACCCWMTHEPSLTWNVLPQPMCFLRQYEGWWQPIKCQGYYCLAPNQDVWAQGDDSYQLVLVGSVPDNNVWVKRELYLRSFVSIPNWELTNSELNLMFQHSWATPHRLQLQEQWCSIMQHSWSQI